LRGPRFPHPPSDHHHYFHYRFSSIIPSTSLYHHESPVQRAIMQSATDDVFTCEERRELLLQLKGALRCEVTPTAWACLWLSDLATLRRTTSSITQDPESRFAWSLILKEVDLGRIVRQCASKKLKSIFSAAYQFQSANTMMTC
jgi:hypothetical protein